jgi:hypothetical protein
MLEQNFSQVGTTSNYLTLRKIIYLIILIIVNISIPIFQNTLKKEEYFLCLCTMGKQENLYAREFIEYYLSIGVEKFIFADNNLPNTEKLSDVLKDYMDKNIVDIIDIIGSMDFESIVYQRMYKNYRNKCKWILYFDFDEYLYIKPINNKTIGIKEFLSDPKFDKCEAIEFNWLLYGDNDLVHYENKSSIQRFTKPIYISGNRFVKFMMRGHLRKKVFIGHQSNHKPQKKVLLCDTWGKLDNYRSHDSMELPEYNHAYLIHFNYRTAEEYSRKVLRGYQGGQQCDILERVHMFFEANNFTKEKLDVFEKNFNKTFPEYHYI